MSASRTKDLNITEGPLLKKIIVFAIPLILTGLLQQLYNAVDGIIVGKFVGTIALAAVGGSAAIIMNTCNGSPLMPNKEKAPQKSRGLIINLPARIRIWSIFIFSIPLDTEFARFEPITSSDSGTVRSPR